MMFDSENGMMIPIYRRTDLDGFKTTRATCGTKPEVDVGAIFEFYLAAGSIDKCDTRSLDICQLSWSATNGNLSIKDMEMKA